ncbi:MAG: dethiobiotin synthetase [Alphaproteobacteria bacterium]|nr:dethiobiotin synthetase [Alphaproteobacteria bacterium]
MTAVFVTSTGTDIGKTFVTAGLIRHFRNAGRAVDAIKPVVTGFDPASAASSDPGVLLAALGRPILADEIERISPWRFQAAASPDIAAQREGGTLDFAAVVDFSRRATAVHKNMLLIEGIGGIMVPLDARHTVLDWMTALRLPLILVAGSYLGTISHTLTALHVLARRNLSTVVVVVSETPGSPVSLEETTGTISRFADSIEVVGLPRLPPGADMHPAFERIAKLL